jgi:hypothetical protein
MHRIISGDRRGAGEIGRMKKITSHRELDVYKLAFDAAMKIFELTKTFPADERFSLTSQIRRASRSVCGNLAEAWRVNIWTATKLKIFTTVTTKLSGNLSE